MNQDRNLLFGVFAVQLRKVTPNRIMAAAAAWAADPSLDLPDRLVSDGGINDWDRELIDHLVEEAVNAHDGDAAKTLETFGGAKQVYASLHGTVVMSSGSWVPSDNRLRAPAVELEDEVPIREIPGRYDEITEHGRGGMGRVLLVHDGALGRDIVLKELLAPPRSEADTNDAASPQDTPADAPLSVSSPAASPAMVTRFLQEAKITGQLEHPSITPVYELGIRADGRPYYTMKLVRGKTLSQALDESETLTERLALVPHFADLCQALAYAHSRGVIHRDLKPANVMIGEFGETVVLDWGLAKVQGKPDAHVSSIDETVRHWHLGHSPDSDMTSPGEILGTPLYMAPEQAKAQHEFIDHRTDVYALGAILYHILAGRPPFEWTTPQEVITRVVNEPPEPVRYLERAAPRALIAICERAMEKHRANRYQNTKNLADDVARYQSGQLVEAHSYSAAELTQHFVRRNRALAAVSSFALVLVIGLFFYFVGNLRTQNVALEDANYRLQIEQLEAEANRRNAEENAAQLKASVAAEQARAAELEWESYVSNIREAQRAIDVGDMLNARRRLAEAPAQYRNWEWGFLAANLDESENSFGDEGQRWPPVFVGVDDRLLFTHEAGFRILDSSSGTVLRSTETHSFFDDPSNLVTTMAEVEALGTVLLGHDDGTVTRWDQRSGKLLQVTSLIAKTEDAEAATVVSISANTRYVVAGHDDGSVSIFETGSLQYLKGQEVATDSARFVDVHPTEPRFFVSAADGVLSSWDIATLSMQWDEQLFDGPFFAMAMDVSPNGDMLVTRMPGTTAAALWNARTGKKLRDLSGDDSAAFSVQFHPTSDHVLTGSERGPVLWEADTGRVQRLFRGHLPRCEGAYFDPTGNAIVSWSPSQSFQEYRRRNVKIWQVGARKGRRLFGDGLGFVNDAELSANGKYLVVATSDRRFRVWETSTKKEIWKSEQFPDHIYFVTVSISGDRVLCLRRNHGMQLWALGATDPLYSDEPAYHADEIHGGFSPDGSRCVVGDIEGDIETVHLLDARTGDALSDLGSGYGSRFSSNGERIVIVDGINAWIESVDGESKGDSLDTFRRNRWLLWSEFSPEGDQIVIAHDDGLLTVHDAQSGKVTSTFSNHSEKTSRAGFSADGTRVVSASDDGSVRVWDRHTASELLVLRDNPGRIAAAAQFGPEGLSLLTAGNAAYLWDALPWNIEMWNTAGASDLAVNALDDAPVREVIIDSVSCAFEDAVHAFDAFRQALGSQADRLTEIDDIGLVVNEGTSVELFDDMVLSPLDVIRSVNGLPVNNTEELFVALDGYSQMLAHDGVMAQPFNLEVRSFLWGTDYTINFAGFLHAEPFWLLGYLRQNLEEIETIRLEKLFNEKRIQGGRFDRKARRLEAGMAAENNVAWLRQELSTGVRIARVGGHEVRRRNVELDFATLTRLGNGFSELIRGVESGEIANITLQLEVPGKPGIHPLTLCIDRDRGAD